MRPFDGFGRWPGAIKEGFAMNFVETFRQLLAAASPSGYEGPEAQVIRQLAQPYCDEIRTDALGNVI